MGLLTGSIVESTPTACGDDMLFAKVRRMDRPSWGHTRRICKILKSEAWHTIRYFEDWLSVILRDGVDKNVDDSRLAVYRKQAAASTEFLWQKMISSLPSKSRPTTTGGMVTALGGVQLPEDIEKVLCKGPKFSFEPSSGRSQLLAMVRQVGDRVAE
ncbi:hypothetical protein HPB47_019351 [Ixodes persulcatus]|uniref:Uncharacterized protein n=1 Tax=Ixodes persulcatus TaxID=34615 RepID=A0AC60QIF1_IXOPE|nr:hypothetical protein HPB47_019351 [Ixodes persulcatus]